LDEALLKAQAEVGGVAKDGRNSHQKYDYVSAEQQLAHAGPVLRRNGLVFSQTSITIINSGNEHLVMDAEYQLSHPNSGQTRCFNKQLPIAGRGDLSKAALAAQTTLLNYALRDLLLIPRGEQFEVDSLPPEAGTVPNKAAGLDVPPAPARPLADMIRAFETYAVAGGEDGWADRVKKFYGVASLKDLSTQQATQVWGRLTQQGKIKEAQNGE
tara:strand:+ start:2876 stop:3514 length:639 start_codon:yes stop_codon:yes gene_type:complete